MQDLQSTIAAELGVASHFDAETEVARRVAFLIEYSRTARANSLVLGISGGVDSTAAGRLCQLATQDLRASGQPTRFIAMRLPYGTQADQADADRALAFIAPDEVLIVDIQPAADAMLRQLKAAGLSFRDAAQEDFVLGNIKARQRMMAQYAVAGMTSGLVVGTDHAAEAVTGFFTKYGDGGFDLTHLGGPTKRRVRAIATELGAEPSLAQKEPAADLETLCPLRPDEAALGVSSGHIDDFLEGRPLPAATAQRIVETYRRTAHKRALPASPTSSFDPSLSSFPPSC